jgi:hypothetical protein
MARQDRRPRRRAIPLCGPMRAARLGRVLVVLKLRRTLGQRAQQGGCRRRTLTRPWRLRGMKAALIHRFIRGMKGRLAECFSSTREACLARIRILERGMPLSGQRGTVRLTPLSGDSKRISRSTRCSGAAEVHGVILAGILLGIRYLFPLRRRKRWRPHAPHTCAAAHSAPV